MDERVVGLVIGSVISSPSSRRGLLSPKLVTTVEQCLSEIGLIEINLRRGNGNRNLDDSICLLYERVWRAQQCALLQTVDGDVRASMCGLQARL